MAKEKKQDEVQEQGFEQQPAPETERQPVDLVTEPKQLDKTVPGGRYIVNGVLVDCNGEPIED